MTTIERQYHEVDINEVSQFLNSVSELAEEHNLEKKDIIEAYKVVELRRKNNLFVSNGDIHDEQIKFISSLLKQISDRLIN